MKAIRFILIALFSIIAFVSAAQAPPKFVYCDIEEVGSFLNGRITIEVDFGQKMKFMADNRLRDEIGELIVFNSIVDALNFMSGEGWEFVQAYTIRINDRSYIHYLMRRPFEELPEEAKREVMKN